MEKPLVAAAAALLFAGCSVQEATDNVTSAAASVSDAVTGLISDDCSIGKPGDEVEYAEARAVYECLSDDMVAGYQNGDKRWIPAAYVDNYRSWVPASALPAAPGFHSGRYLLTFVNDTGATEYLKFAEEGVDMPAGSVIAKESFSINDDGKAEAGPLFIMEKAAEGSSPQTDDWYYMMVSAKGAPQGINVVKACHECHSGFAEQDYLGYPVEEVRVGG